MVGRVGGATGPASFNSLLRWCHAGTLPQEPPGRQCSTGVGRFHGDKGSVEDIHVALLQPVARMLQFPYFSPHCGIRLGHEFHEFGGGFHREIAQVIEQGEEVRCRRKDAVEEALEERWFFLAEACFITVRGNRHDDS